MRFCLVPLLAAAALLLAGPFAEANPRSDALAALALASTNDAPAAKAPDFVLVKFTGEKCVPCQRLAPKLAKATPKGIRVHEYVSEDPAAAYWFEQWRVVKVPVCYLMTTDGYTLASLEGDKTEAEIAAFFAAGERALDARKNPATASPPIRVAGSCQGGSCSGSVSCGAGGSCSSCTTCTFSSTTVSGITSGPTVADALDEVNAKRASKGLRPLIRDGGLAAAAQRCAEARAAALIAGHLANDFAMLPPGSHAASAGCGALEPSWGWETCCYDDPRYSVAGAAWVWGRDGKRYMHIFVR